MEPKFGIRNPKRTTLTLFIMKTSLLKHTLFVPTLALAVAMLPVAVRAQFPQRNLTTDLKTGEMFGYSVAISCHSAIVGVRYDTEAAPGGGAAHVFVRSGFAWTHQAKLLAADAAMADYLGFATAISGDTAVAGAPYADVSSQDDAGAVYVFTRAGTNWTQQQKLTASDAGSDDNFGQTLAISGDTIIVGAPYDYVGTVKSGSAFVFTRTAGHWTQQAKLSAPTPSANMEFGGHVAISGDTVIIGAYRDPEKGKNAGAAYVFTRSGTAWILQQQLTAADAQPYDWFSHGGVAISGDWAAVSQLEGGGMRDFSSVYLFRRSGGHWEQDQKIAAKPDWDPKFACSIALSGRHLVVGSCYDGAAGELAGAAYLYEYREGDWKPMAKLCASDTGPQNLFGNCVAIDGGYFVCSAVKKNAQTGAAYAFYIPPRILPDAFTRLPDGTVRFRFECLDAAAVEVQCAESLGEWTTVRTIPAPQEEEEVEDQRPGVSMRFYRLRVIP